MRIVLTTLLLLVAGFLAGALVAQALAVGTSADQEFILVFMVLALVWMASSVAFIVVQFLADPRRAAATVAVVLSALVVVCGVAMVGIDMTLSEGGSAETRSWPVVAGLVVPNLATILVQFLVVRWRNPAAAPAMLFGRGPGAPA